MQRTRVITMAMQELARLKVFRAVIDRLLEPSVAAERLALTDRQIRRLVNRVRYEDPTGIVSRRCGQSAMG